MIRLFVIATVLWLAAFSCHGQEKVEYKTYVEVGQTLPMTVFGDIQGQQIVLTDSSNNKLLVLFATWCHDSQRAMKAIMASHLATQTNIDIIGIGREESVESLKNFAAEYQLNFPLVADTDRSIYAQFANAGVPRLILIDGNNTIVKTIIAENEQPLAQVQWH